MPRPRSCPIMPPMADITFTGCDPLSPERRDVVAASRRREIVVGGRRVKTIDVHAHCVVPKAMVLMGQTPSANEMRGPGISEVGMRRLREMDEQGIDVEAISINPFWYRAE